MNIFTKSKWWLQDKCEQIRAYFYEEKLKKLYSEKFIEYLVSDNVQKELNQIKMYSEFISVDYEEENYKNMQAVKGVKSLSAYTSQAQLKELQRISMLNLAGENDYINKIKNVLI
jgi:hypothetical protein